MTTTVETHTHSCQFSDDGSSWTDFSNVILGFTTHHAIDADRGTCEIRCSEYPSGLSGNAYVICYIDGELVFNGHLARPARAGIAGDITFQCEDVMANIANPWGGEGTDPELDELNNREYESQTDGAIITNLCEAMAVPVSLHDIEDSAWTMGTLSPIVCRVGQTPLEVIREIDGLALYWTAGTNNGAITRRPISVDPGDVAFTAEEGINIISGTRQPQGTESIKNRCIVYGFEYEGAAIGGLDVGDYQEANSNIPDPPKSRTVTKRSNMVQDDADALAFATNEVAHRNFPYDECNLVVLCEPTHTIGESWLINAPDGLDYANDDSSLRMVHTLEYRYGADVGYEVSVKLIRAQKDW